MLDPGVSCGDCDACRRGDHPLCERYSILGEHRQGAEPEDLPPPNGYSHVVSLPPGRLVWTSGQVPIGPDGTLAEGWEEQTRTAFANVGRALAAAGADWPHVVKLTIFVVDVSELATGRSSHERRAAPPQHMI